MMLNVAILAAKLYTIPDSHVIFAALSLVIKGRVPYPTNEETGDKLRHVTQKTGPFPFGQCSKYWSELS
ncbi:hypothetical protein VNO77_12033 [Canavalia gladiata]|uniref:Uncharacterized protein n=1 Tax=Canavalia gladiata TaxID=3824 RepID=A0AAN9LWX1_CANGL